MNLLDTLQPATVTIRGARMVNGKCGLGGTAAAWEKLAKDKLRRRDNKRNERAKKRHIMTFAEWLNHREAKRK